MFLPVWMSSQSLLYHGLTSSALPPPANHAMLSVASSDLASGFCSTWECSDKRESGS